MFNFFTNPDINEELRRRAWEHIAEDVDSLMGNDEEMAKSYFAKMIRHEGNEYCVFSEDGSKKLGCHPTRKEAIRQLMAIEENKLNKSVASTYAVERLAVDLGFSINGGMRGAGPGNKDATTLEFLKVDSDKRLVGGIVYSPCEKDSQDDWAMAEEIEKAAHNYMIKCRKTGYNHKEDITEKTSIVESYIAPQDLLMGRERVKKGSWVMVLKIHDDSIWSDVKSGKLTGFSMRGKARNGE